MEETGNYDLNILHKHWQDAKNFSSLFFDYVSNDKVVKQKATKEFAIGIISEVNELLNTINWKVHRLEKYPVFKTQVLEEIIDIYKYLVSIASLWGISPEEFCDEFDRKDLVNWQRYKQEQMLLNLANKKRVCAIDIDGVLCRYPENLLKFLNEKLSLNIKLSQITELHGIENIYALFGVDIKQYRMLKEEFAESDMFCKNVEVADGASEFTNRLKLLGYTVVLLSGRPYKQHNRIFADTIEWCKKNRIAYDVIMWDKNKDLNILKNFKNLKFLVEDDPDIATSVAKLGYKVLLVERPYNNFASGENIIKIKSLMEVFNDIDS
jgi:uncharacterized HAD superfamily protein